MHLRPATADDFDLLAAMLLEAFNWDGQRRFTLDQLKAEDHAWRYVDGWMRAGDFGVVAELDSRPVGAAWARLLTADRPGYGYVSDDVPELSIGVSPDTRGQGVGRAVLTALVDAAREAAYERISLSVEPENRAAELYRSLGFRAVGRNGGSDTMVLDL
ncbi:GNAT family N-acetyltransferase [Kribbella sp. ALI-6-A]|uniref:GNAT family N-acetyltransferase n=1 Tax=Kribbella sp. ALI-6-A TaxID=1933817 RepID=UPI00097BDDE3|nr:GNAT family N-acetyltransferase [Kribbella sp. ALI-6-A]ONI69128.1 GNAT family N-acetyltransferase [Kribbella sp. ALI-6-A]